MRGDPGVFLLPIPMDFLEPFHIQIVGVAVALVAIVAAAVYFSSKKSKKGLFLSFDRMYLCVCDVISSGFSQFMVNSS